MERFRFGFSVNVFDLRYISFSIFDHGHKFGTCAADFTLCRVGHAEQDLYYFAVFPVRNNRELSR